MFSSVLVACIGSPTSELLPFDLKLEKTLRKLKKSNVEQV